MPISIGLWEGIRIACWGVLVLGALGIEWKTQKIPNLLTYALTLVALILAVAEGRGSASPWTPVSNAALGLVLCMAIGVAIFATQGAGGGMVKLLAATGAVVRSPVAIYLAIFSLAICFVFRRITVNNPRPVMGSLVILVCSILAVMTQLALMMLDKK